LGDRPVARLASLLPDDEEGRRVATVVSDLLGGAATASPSGPGEPFWAVRRLLSTLARLRPLVVVLEDVHWAEPTLLDLVEYLESFGREAPLFLLCLARPELLEKRPRWSERTILLEPLRKREVEALIDNLAPPDVGTEVRARAATAAEGNPLVAEQLLGWLSEGGSVDAPPPSVEALIQSRIDQLPTEERTALERGAVLGREFTADGVGALSAPESTAWLNATLLALTRKRLLDPAPAPQLENDGFRFHHALVRDVAYARTPKAVRAELHERTAEWLEREADKPEELVGYHLEQAYRFREELGPVDRHARALAADAGRQLGRAGIAAWKRGDVPAAVNLLGRATALLPGDDELRRELVCELGVALRSAGDTERAEDVLAGAVDAAAAVNDARAALRARIELADIRLFSRANARADELLELAESAIPVFEALGDQRSLGRTWLLVGFVHGGLHCRNAAWQDAAERALVHYRAAGWPPATCVSNVVASLYHGPTPVSEAVDRCGGFLHDAVDRGTRAHVLTILAALEALAGRFAEARTLVSQARRLYEELGQAVFVAGTAVVIAGQIELLAEEIEAAERLLRESCTALERMGVRRALATRASELAEVLYLEERYEEAGAWTELAEANAIEDDISAAFSWRSVRAKVLARRGAHDDAEALARQALALVEETDALNQHAKVLLDLAEVLRLAGRAEAAASCLDSALDLYRRKGNVVGARRTQALLGALAAA
ncbi:MAG: tetratricopeptide repeat protein, partial [Actinomycetota bacterium]|nr:tetratricopeptide repeat protein [Actinomycetota bacterium]